MKKALVVIQDLSMSGSPQTFIHVIEALSKCSFQTDVLAYSIFDDRVDLFLENDYRKIVDTVYKRSLKATSFLHRLFPAFFLKKMLLGVDLRKYDLVISNNFIVCSQLVKKKNRPKVIFYSLGYMDTISRFLLLRLIDKRNLNRLIKVDYLLYLSSRTIPEYLRHNRKTSSTILIDYPNYEAKNIKKINVSDNVIRLGQIGYFCDNKNQHFSLEVVNELNKRGYHAIISFIGYAHSNEHNYYDLLNQYIIENELQDFVSFHKSDYDKNDFFSNCDVLLFPSKSEGLGLVSIESQLSKTFCLSSINVPPETDFGMTAFRPLVLDEWVSFLENKLYKNYNLNENIDLRGHFETSIISVIQSLFPLCEAVK